MKQFISAKPFPSFIMGSDIFLRVQNADDESRVAEVVNMVNRNKKEFGEFLDLGHYSNFETAKKVMAKREEFAKNGLLVDYSIQLFDGKVVGGINFVNRGDGSVGVIYYVDKQYQGMRFCQRALALAEPELKKLGFDSVVLEINEKNESSIRVALKSGYIFHETGSCMKDYIKKLR